MTCVVRLPVMILIVLMLCPLSLGCGQPPAKVQRFGHAIGVKKEAIPEYRRLHANCWPGVLRMLKQCNIRNYSIYLAEIKPDEYCLFAYFEYTGDDFQKDMDRMKADPTTREWWKHTDPMQYKLLTAGQDEWWHKLDEVFHMP
ncbi:MAG TPA: L-rhamnose mutarotase [Phycisphaerae bacterium]|nr:L-rhamnose mutarotase [Phycisphaerae bacterium]